MSRAGIDLITTSPEQRQIAKVIELDDYAEYLDWNKVAKTARDLGAHFEVRFGEGGCCITMFWRLDP
jgi:hypothetical protein